jgi:TolB protein
VRYLRNLDIIVILSAAVILTASVADAQTDVRLRVTTEGHVAIRIVLTEPGEEQDSDTRAYHETFHETLKNDLDISGYFDIVNDPEKDEPHAIVESVVQVTGVDLSFNVELTDRSSRQSIFKRRYGSSPGAIVSVAHVVADDIVFALTGRAGIANTYIAFVAGEKGNSHLYRVHIDGSDLLRLTEAASIVMSPAWSPDFKRIAYVSYAAGNSAVYVVETTTLNTIKFASFEGMNATPAWSPNGRKIALTLSKDGNPEIYVLSLDGKTRKRITYYSGIDCSPTWAPNGLEIAFTSDRTGSPQIHITDAEGLSIRRVTEEGSYNTSPAWSPTGDLIAFVTRDAGRFQICTVDPFGVTTSFLTDTGNNEDPSWSPDGMHIVFSSTRGGNSSIYIINKDGTGERRVVEGMRHPRNPAWASKPGYDRTSLIVE